MNKAPDKQYYCGTKVFSNESTSDKIMNRPYLQTHTPYKKYLKLHFLTQRAFYSFILFYCFLLNFNTF